MLATAATAAKFTKTRKNRILSLSPVSQPSPIAVMTSTGNILNRQSHHLWRQTSRFSTHFIAARSTIAMATTAGGHIDQTAMDSVKTSMDRGENNKAGDGIRTHDVQLGNCRKNRPKNSQNP
ncbi:MAG: hypothetical protein ACP5O1_12465 [Phycisphaerae bacterium]